MLRGEKLCEFTAAAMAWVLCVVLLTLSLLAITHVSSAWSALDYWLAWFAGITFIAGMAGMGMAIIASFRFWDGICN